MQRPGRTGAPALRLVALAKFPLQKVELLRPKSFDLEFTAF